MIDKLKTILENYSSISEKMANPEIIGNVSEYAKLAKEHRQLSETVTLAKQYIKTYNHIQEDEEILDGMIKIWKKSSFDGGRHMTRMKKAIALRGQSACFTWGVMWRCGFKKAQCSPSLPSNTNTPKNRPQIMVRQ